jgi:hypothetical protein
MPRRRDSLKDDVRRLKLALYIGNKVSYKEVKYNMLYALVFVHLEMTRCTDLE